MLGGFYRVQALAILVAFPAEQVPLDKIVRDIVASKEKIKTRRIAVTVFTDENQKITPDADWLAERLTTELARTGQFYVVERRRLHTILEELKLDMVGLIDTETARKVGRMLGAEAIVYGTLRETESKVAVDVKVTNVETGRVISAITVQKDKFVRQLTDLVRMFIYLGAYIGLIVLLAKILPKESSGS